MLLREGFVVGFRCGWWQKVKGVGRVGSGDRQRNRQVNVHLFVKTTL